MEREKRGAKGFTVGVVILFCSVVIIFFCSTGIFRSTLEDLTQHKNDVGYLIESMDGYLKVSGFLGVMLMILFAVFLIYLKKERHQREKMLFTDTLTGVYNREGFLWQGAKLADIREYRSYAIVYLNMINFRRINEVWSEEEGNRTLQFMGKIFSKGLKEQELVCRSDMDHFFLLLKEPDDQKVISRIDQMLVELNEYDKKGFCGYLFEFTVGACRVEEAGILSTAMNKAVYASKAVEEKNNCIFFRGEIARKAEREQWMNSVFEEGLSKKHFQVYLQPKVALSDGKEAQAEALVRWVHPEEGMIYPTEFIPLFEKNKKICELDLYVFEAVCQLLAEWMQMGKPLTRISVNLSRFHLKKAGKEIWKEYRDIKEKYKIPDGMLELELTETVLLEDSQLMFIRDVFENFRSNGIKIALDDFGMAYSSLSLLKNFEVDVLKLDRAFFVDENEKSHMIVESTIRLAHSLGIIVVAEGIEHQEQVKRLKEMKCDLIQGYICSRPLSIGKFETWRKLHAK